MAPESVRSPFHWIHPTMEVINVNSDACNLNSTLFSGSSSCGQRPPGQPEGWFCKYFQVMTNLHILESLACSEAV